MRICPVVFYTATTSVSSVRWISPHLGRILTLFKGEWGQAGSCALQPQVVAIGNVWAGLLEDWSLIPDCCVILLKHGPHTGESRKVLGQGCGTKEKAKLKLSLNIYAHIFVQHHKQLRRIFSSKGWVYTTKLGVYNRIWKLLIQKIRADKKNINCLKLLNINTRIYMLPPDNFLTGAQIMTGSVKAL